MFDVDNESTFFVNVSAEHCKNFLVGSSIIIASIDVDESCNWMETLALWKHDIGR